MGNAAAIHLAKLQEGDGFGFPGEGHFEGLSHCQESLPIPLLGLGAISDLSSAAEDSGWWRLTGERNSKGRELRKGLSRWPETVEAKVTGRESRRGSA